MKQLMKTRCPDCQAWYWCGKACEHRVKDTSCQIADDIEATVYAEEGLIPSDIERDAAARTAELEAKHKEWREGQEQI